MASRGASMAGFAGGVLAGLVLGYVVAVLLAPEEGVETRARLQEGADALLTAPRDLADHAQARLQHALDEGRQAAADARAALEASSGLRYDGDSPKIPPTTST